MLSFVHPRWAIKSMLAMPKGYLLVHLSILSLSPLLLFAVDTGPIITPGEQTLLQKEGMTAQSGALNAPLKAAMTAKSSSGTNDIMIVDPKMVSQDWIDAFHSLQLKRVMDISFLLRDSTEVSNVVDIETMPGGYLMVFTLKTVQGPKYKIVKTSDISSLVSR